MTKIKFERLENLVKRVNVGFVGSISEFYCDSEEDSVPIIRTCDIEEFNFNNLKYVSKEFHLINKKSQVRKGDLIIARHGNNGNAMHYNLDIEAQVLNAVIISPDDSKIKSSLLKLYFSSPF
ncbi:restriction endonuclease subunit S, partial [Flavobacteriaceae bacterium]|nr:restriction endonuclease subunit S [Flavobacteriaceae bacterium]